MIFRASFFKISSWMETIKKWLICTVLCGCFGSVCFGQDELPKTTGTISFSGYIDGTDHLHIQNDKVWYVHGAWQLPGKWSDDSDGGATNQGNEPTYINGDSWYPGWSDGSTSSSYTLDPPLPCGRFSVQLTNVQCDSDEGGGISIEQSPDPDNGNEAIVFLDDDEPGGPHWISFNLVWTLQSSCDSSSCSYGAGSGGVGSNEDGTLAGASISLGDGQLYLSASNPDASLATPSALGAAVGSDATVITDGNGAPSQVIGTSVVASIQIISAQKYTASLYYKSQASGGTGLQAFTGDPYAVWTVENPGNIGDPLSTLKITQQQGSLTNVTEFSWPTGNNQQVVYSSGNGLRTETRNISYEVGSATEYQNGTGNRIETITVTGSSSALVSKTVNIFHYYSWGEEQIEQILDPEGSALTTQWAYITDNSANGCGSLQQIIKPSGYWERYEYDSQNRQTKIVAQYKDAPLGTDESLCHVTTTAYDSSDDSGGYGSGTAISTQTVVETILNQEVSRYYSVSTIQRTANYDIDGKRHDGLVIYNQTKLVRCQTAGATISDSANLVTTTTYVPNWSFADGYFVQNAFSGCPQSILKPDGTLTLYTYSNDASTKTTVMLAGQPNSDNTSVVDGTQTVIVTDPSGNTLSTITSDIASGLVTSSSVAQSTDAFGRPLTVAGLSGTTVNSYGCCGLESQTDVKGITTSYVYDALKRTVASTRAGVTTLTSYDAQSNVVSTSRAGTGMATIVTGSAAYDLAGRETSSMNALSNQTTYVQSKDTNGHLVKTTTYPDQSTRIETYFVDGQLKEVAGSAAHPSRYDYGADADGKWSKEIHVAADGSESEWVKTWYDAAGHAWKTLSSSGASTFNYYNGKGQVWKTVDGDGVTTLYQYNAKGEQEYAATDMNRNDAIDFDGTDRITHIQNYVLTDQGTTVARTTTTSYGSPNSITINETSADGLRTWNTVNGLTSTSVTSYDGQGGKTVTASVPDGTVATQVYQNNLLISTSTQNTSVGVLSSGTLTYDGYGRQISSTDARNIVTTTAYDNADRVISTTVSGGGVSQTTAYILNYQGLATQASRPDGTVTYAYQPTGEITDISGGQNCPAHYTYDSQGRMKTLTTWRDYTGNTGAEVTTWNYDASSGLLTSKTYDGGQGTSYTYTSAGRLASRTWARGITTTYGNDNGGTLASVQYSDSTPAITVTRNPQGQIATVTQGSSSVAMTWTASGQLTSENWSGGPLDGITISGSYDSMQRLSAIGCQAIGYWSNLTYDAASRFASIGSGSASVQYGYLPNSSLVQTVAYGKGGNTVMTTTKSYDGLNRLSGINSSVSGTIPSAHTYSYNAANQRTGATLADGSYWVYQYDSLGQVISGKKYLAGGTELGGEQYGYGFDNIGNRTSTCLNNRSAAYTVNGNNQYTQREVPGAIDVIGTGGTSANIAVNGQAASRQGEAFYNALSVSNTNGAVYQSLSVIAAKAGAGSNGADIVAKQTGHVYVPQTPEQYNYDLDGNLTADGRWTYNWDGENRLTAMETNTAAVTAGAPNEKIEFAYDWQGRRIQKTVSLWSTTAGAYQISKQMKHAYWGWNLIGELNESNTVIRSYAWGPDLSGNLTGAGGVGGLVMITDGSSGMSYAPAYDGNGNITALVCMDDSGIAASYEYGPFGEPMRISGAMAGQNPFRFSTKYTDDETGLLYYGYRYYNPNTGRWINRDPIEENGGENLYGMLCNNANNKLDPLGLFSYAEGVDWFYNGGGVSKTIAFSEVDNGIHPADFPDWDAKLNSIKKQNTTLAINMTSLTQNVGGGPGRITFQLTGSIKSTACKWKLENGTIKANDDMFDFNSRPWGERTWYNEVFTRVGGAVGHGTGGHDFLMKFYGSRKVQYEGDWK